MKKAEPNCGAPQGLPHGRTPSRISLVHSKACMPTKVAPKSCGREHQERRFAAVAAVAEIDRHRHRAAAADQDEGHDGDQDQRDRRAADGQREDLARVGPGHGRRRAHRHVGGQEQLKMKVSLRRKIHIMAFPQDPLERLLIRRPVGDEFPGKPAGPGVVCLAVCADAGCVNCSPSPLVIQQQREENQPDQQQEVPVDGAQIDAQAHLVGLTPRHTLASPGPRRPGRPAGAARAAR